MLSGLVEDEVRRPDDRHRVRAHLRRVRGERHRLGRRLRAAVNRDLEASVRRLEEEVGDAPTFLDTEEDPLPGRSEREDPVQARVDVEVDERPEGVVVERASVLPQGCDRRRERSVEHRRTLSSGAMTALKVVRDGHVLRVTLAKPERRNAFDAALIAELTEAFADVGDARAVLLEGEGPAFCAGADVEWQRAAIDLSYDENVEDAMRLHSMLETIDSCPAPVVCCVHGFALGGGSGLVACSDIAVAWPDAVFGFTEVRLGIIPAVISPFVLAKVGSAARRYFVTGERFGPEVALRIGLVSEVSEDAGERAEQIVADILAGGPIAVREAKKLVAERPTGVETAHIAAARRTSDEGQDGLRAFLERRVPGWLGETS